MLHATMLAMLLALAPDQAVPVEPVYVTFGSSVRVPGETLEAGSYVFAAGAPIAGQIVIDVYRAGSMTFVTSVLALEASLLARPDAATLVDYRGTSPPALRAWFHPGFRHGYEFVYPEAEAAAIFETSGEQVPAAAFRGQPLRAGLIAIDHVDSGYRGGVPDASNAGAGEAMGPIDQLALARVAVLSHLPHVAPPTATRLRLLNAQLAALTASYVSGDGLGPERLRLARATLENSLLVSDEELTHTLERVRERLQLFAEAIR
jgi:hypothetical protein